MSSDSNEVCCHLTTLTTNLHHLCWPLHLVRFLAMSKEGSPEDSGLGNLLGSYMEHSRSRPSFPRHATVDSFSFVKGASDSLGALHLFAPGLNAQDISTALDRPPVPRMHSPFPQSERPLNDGLLQELTLAKKEVEALKSMVRPLSTSKGTHCSHILRIPFVWQTWLSKSKSSD